MGEENTDSKLSTQLAQETQSETCTKEKLRFTDYAIERHQSNFIDPKTNKTKDRVYTPLNLNKNSALKGLRLVQYYTTRKKYFQLNYWYNGKSKPLTLGEFIPGKFGTREVQEKIFRIYKAHTNDKGIWIKDPKQTLKDEDNKVYESEAIKLNKKSIREIIEEIVKKNFPSIESSGNLVASSQKAFSLYMFGYNKRTLLMYYSDDDKGNGRIHYKGNKFYNIAKPDDSEDLFKKFPSGHGVIEENKRGKKYGGKYKNRTDEISLYDHDLSKHLIEHLSDQVIRDYINEKERTYSKKRMLKRMFTYIWLYAVENGYLATDKLNPTTHIKIKRPGEDDISKGAQYNNKRFDNKQLQVLWNSLLKLQNLFPFSSMALCLYMVTGVRLKSLLKIKKDYIKKEFIELPPGIMKTKDGLKIPITPVVRWILDNIEQTKKQEKYKKYNFLPWLFPSTKSKSKNFYDEEYIHTDGTRLKDVRGCWKAVEADTGIKGAPKMFRKTFISLSKIVLKDNFKVMFLSGHTKEATIDIHYNKSTDEQQKEYAHEVAEKVFNFTK